MSTQSHSGRCKPPEATAAVTSMSSGACAPVVASDSLRTGGRGAFLTFRPEFRVRLRVVMTPEQIERRAQAKREWYLLAQAHRPGHPIRTEHD